MIDKTTVKLAGKLTFLLLSASIILNTACSSSDSSGTPPVTTSTFSGTTTPAAINDSNAESIGKASGEAIQIADSSTGLPSGISVSDSSSTALTLINEIVIANANILSLPSGIDIPDVCTTGSASISDVPSATSGPVDMTITYNNCAISGVTVNGQAIFHYDDFLNTSAGFTITYINFTVNDGTSTQTINATMVCTSFTSCVTNSDFVGNDGVTHRVTYFSINGNASSGYSGTATFFHGTYGSVSITASNITYGACGTYPDGGSITFQSNGTSGSITFNSDCTVSGTWNNGTTSGSF